MTLLRKVKQKGKGLIGITESGEEIPVVEHQRLQTEKDHFKDGSDRDSANLGERYVSKVKGTLRSLDNYFLVGEPTSESSYSQNNGNGIITIIVPYTRYKRVPSH